MHFCRPVDLAERVLTATVMTKIKGLFSGAIGDP
jgi:hypothetical protein